MVCIIIGKNNFEIIRNFVEDIILVSDKEIKKYVIFVFGSTSCKISNYTPSRKVYITLTTVNRNRTIWLLYTTKIIIHFMFLVKFMLYSNQSNESAV